MGEEHVDPGVDDQWIVPGVGGSADAAQPLGVATQIREVATPVIGVFQVAASDAGVQQRVDELRWLHAVSPLGVGGDRDVDGHAAVHESECRRRMLRCS